MKQFFKFLFASTLGVFLAIVLVLFMGIGIAAISVTAIESQKSITLTESSILHIKLDYPINDRTSNDPLENLDWGTMKSQKSLGLNSIIENINKAKGDDNIDGIYLDLSFISAGYATIGEIRDALHSFSDETGKFIFCYSEMMSQKAYYLASVSDKIYLNPEGYIQLTGLAANLSFFKGTLEKLDIEPQVIRHGKFKSAVEPFINDKMSPENKTQIETFLNGIWDHVRDEISTGRGLSTRELNLITDSLWADNANGAMENYIADELHYKDELLADIRELIELEEDEEIPFISLTKYDRVPKTRDKDKKKTVVRDRIAVIYAQGAIVSGNGGKDEIGSERISRAIRKARLNDKVKAIVLRVNSGGGSALASDVIWREMRLAREVKPVVASMGDVAASGGYYIACGADTILASKSTITGSIGVLGILFNMQGFYNNKLGITFDGVKTNPYADLGNLSRPLTDAEKRIIQKEIERIYDVFITHVAEGRGLTKEQVDSIGQGRVWAGGDAKDLGLVDVIGGLERAIEIAQEMAGLEEYRLLELPKQKDPLEELLAEIMGEGQEVLLKHQLGDVYSYMQELQKVSKLQGIQAVLPYEINIQ